MSDSHDSIARVNAYIDRLEGVTDASAGRAPEIADVQTAIKDLKDVVHGLATVVGGLATTVGALSNQMREMSMTVDKLVRNCSTNRRVTALLYNSSCGNGDRQLEYAVVLNAAGEDPTEPSPTRQPLPHIKRLADISSLAYNQLYSYGHFYNLSPDELGTTESTRRGIAAAIDIGRSY